MTRLFSSLKQTLNASTLAQTFLFLYAILGAFLLTFTLKLFALWTGDAPTWKLLFSGFAGGCLLMVVLTRYAARFIGGRVCSWIAFAVAILTCLTFGNTLKLVETWYTVCQQQALTYDAWQSFISMQAHLWFLPILLTFPTLWQRNEAPRGRLTFFCGACIGVILARLFVGAVSTLLLLEVCLSGLLLLSLLWMLTTSRTLIGRILSGLLLIVFALAYYMGTIHTSQDLIHDVHPFASIAKPDSLFRGSHLDATDTTKYTFLDGRIVRVKGMDEASLITSQTIPLLLKPTPNARIVARPQVGTPAYDFFEAGELKGKCDALWIELPPAWLATEQDYFSTSAMTTIADHLMDDGILIYDMDARPLDEEMLRRRAAMLRTKFPHMQLWMTALNRWQLVASRQPITTDFTTLDSLIDREEVMRVLRQVNIEAPITLLACCLMDDCARLEENRDAVEVDLRLNESTLARQNLFDRRAGLRLIDAVLPLRSKTMPWVKLPPMLDPLILEALCDAKALILTGLQTANKETFQYYQEASKLLSSDPILLSEAAHYYAMARDLEAVGQPMQALDLYAITMTYAQPSLTQVLHAAELARKNSQAERALGFFRVAGDIAPDDPIYLKAYINFLCEFGQFKEAEQHCLKLLRLLGEGLPSEQLAARFWLGVCIAQQPERKEEGIRVLRRLVAQLQTPEEKALYIPAYAQFLIDMGLWVEGRNIRRHFDETGTLLPPSPQEQ